jgi:hypothetical protein
VVRKADRIRIVSMPAEKAAKAMDPQAAPGSTGAPE